MKRRLCLAVLAASLACSAAQAQTYSVMYSFGDSLSDVGNALIVSTLLGKPVPLPDFYYEGRFSNGPNWLDDLSAKLPNHPPVEPNLPPKDGDDFAFGGAQTGPTNVNTGLPTDLLGQVAEFQAQVPSRASDALYTLDIGANDIGNALSAYEKNHSFDLSKFLTDAVDNTVGAVGALYADGARDLLYYEVPDLSIVPAFAAGGALGGALAMAFNEDVLGGIKDLELEGKLDGLTVFDVPIFAALDKIVKNPGEFGFTNATTPCFSGSFDSPGTECADPNDYVFWDGEHPTKVANALTADLAYDVLMAHTDPAFAPEPSTWAMLLIGFAGLAFAGWRAQRFRVALARA